MQEVTLPLHMYKALVSELKTLANITKPEVKAEMLASTTTREGLEDSALIGLVGGTARGVLAGLALYAQGADPADVNPLDY